MVEPIRFAPEGTIWLCQNCGRTARDLLGKEGDRDEGWSDDCQKNALLCVEGTTHVRTSTGMIQPTVAPWPGSP